MNARIQMVVSRIIFIFKEIIIFWLMMTEFWYYKPMPKIENKKMEIPRWQFAICYNPRK